jgi:hypothetical protein
MNIDPDKPWPFPSNIIQGDNDAKLIADCLALLQDFTAFQLRGEIYYGYLDTKALKVIESLRAGEELRGATDEAEPST